jgi:hypothetical protein
MAQTLAIESDPYVGGTNGVPDYFRIFGNKNADRHWDLQPTHQHTLCRIQSGTVQFRTPLQNRYSSSRPVGA